MKAYTNSTPETTEDRAIVEIGESLNARWRAEVALLGAIAPAPKYRCCLADRLGMTLDDLTFADTNLIGRALAVGHKHGRDICAKLARNLLIEDGFWDRDELRPFATSTTWGPGPLAAIFSRLLNITNESEIILAATEHVRSLPAEKSLPAWRAA